MGQAIHGFRVFYRQGSFTLADLCGSWDAAIAHAERIRSRRGVWLVRIEDAEGHPVPGGQAFDPAWEGAAVTGHDAGAAR
jgi:hypothetical protein